MATMKSHLAPRGTYDQGVAKRLTLWVIQEVRSWTYLTPADAWSRRICDARLWRDETEAAEAAANLHHKTDTIFIVRLTAEIQAMRRIPQT
jgi:hypothetical protein